MQKWNITKKCFYFYLSHFVFTRALRRQKNTNTEISERVVLGGPLRLGTFPCDQDFPHPTGPDKPGKRKPKLI